MRGDGSLHLRRSSQHERCSVQHDHAAPSKRPQHRAASRSLVRGGPRSRQRAQLRGRVPRRLRAAPPTHAGLAERLPRVVAGGAVPRLRLPEYRLRGLLPEDRSVFRRVLQGLRGGVVQRGVRAGDPRRADALHAAGRGVGGGADGRADAAAGQAVRREAGAELVLGDGQAGGGRHGRDHDARSGRGDVSARAGGGAAER